MNNFFGTKLNTVLLIILIILMIAVIKIMYLNKDTYLPFLKDHSKPSDQIVDPQILGNKDDLVSFSIVPGSKVRGLVSYRGVIKGAYFFEANIVINILDVNKKLLKASNAMAVGDWMTSGPVNFEGNIDFSSLPKGSAYIQIHNDNPSDMRQYDKSVLIPIVIE